MNLEKPFFRKRQCLASRNHKVVQYPHVDKGQGLLQLRRKLPIGGARLGHPRWVIVREYDSTGVVD